MCKDVKITTEQLTKAMDAEQQKLVEQVIVNACFLRGQARIHSGPKFAKLEFRSTHEGRRQLDYKPQGKL